MLFQSLEPRQLFAVNISGLTATITGTAGDDVIRLDREDDVIVVDVNGESTPLPGVVEALVQGLDGDDLIGFDKELLLWVTLEGNAGNDTLFGSGGNDVLRGGDGNDELHDSGGDDALLGQNGDDLLIADFEANNASTHVYRDYLDGGGGKDVLDFSHAVLPGNARPFFRPTISHFTNENGTRSVFGGSVFGVGADHVIANYETIRTTNLDDDIKLIVHDKMTDEAGTKSLHLDTLKGNDTIVMVAVNDAFFGPFNLAIDTGDGNDSVLGDPVHSMISVGLGAGDDSIALPAFVTPRLRFGRGRDQFTVVDGGYFPGQKYVMPDDLEIFIGHNVAEIVGNQYDNVIHSINGSTVIGGDGNDQITTQRVSFVDGGRGNDTIRTIAGSQNTIVFGGEGNDVLIGGDHLYGDTGDDRLIDTLGRYLNGGPGRDRYQLKAPHSIFPIIARDGEIDIIDLADLNRSQVLNRLKADRNDIILGGR